MHPATRRQLVGVATLLAVAAGATVVVSPATAVGVLERLADRPLVFGVVLCGVYLVRPLFLWPVSFVALVLGYLYDPWLAIPVSIAGAGLTGLPPYLLARYAPTRRGAAGALGSRGRDLAGTLGETRSVVVARLLPVPGDAVSYGAGLSRVSVGAFLLGTGIGEVPWTLAMVAVGDSMRTLTVDGVRFGPELALGLAGLAVILLAGPVYRHLSDGSLAE